MKRASLWAVLVISWCAVTLDAAPLLTHVDVYVSGKDGYQTYRIPAIETAPDGSLLAFAEARKYNAADPGCGKQDIDLVLKRSTDGGQTWSAMRVIEDPGELWSAANPATVVDRQTRRVWLLYLRSKPERSTDTSRPGTDDMGTFARWSDDNGVTWSEPMDLSRVARDYRDPKWQASVIGPGGAIQTRTGRLVAPVWKLKPWGSLAMFSDDHGRSWQRGQVMPGTTGGDEDQLVELADGRLRLDIRQNRGPRRFAATSRDGGRTWSEPRPAELVTPVCCAIERLTLKSAGDDRDRILWTGPKGPARKTLVARVSYDEGETFPCERLISDEPAAYSDLTVLKDKTVGVLWERANYRFLTFTRLNVEFLEGGR
jgi:sialidase-1